MGTVTKPHRHAALSNSINNLQSPENGPYPEFIVIRDMKAEKKYCCLPLFSSADSF